MSVKLYEVGGAVRDSLLGVPNKDIDYVAVLSDVESIDTAWEELRTYLYDAGFKVFLEVPQYQTIRAMFPKDHPEAGTVADVVLARKEGPYLDGRRPSWVRPGTLEDDLRRRDFSINALARAEDGSIIDLFGGQDDLEARRLRAVGDPLDRLKEDALRAFRAIRFAITKGFWIDDELAHAMRTVRVYDALADNISAERIKDELHKCFAFDSVKTIQFLVYNFPAYLTIMQDKGIWLEPTMRQAPGGRPKKDPVNTDSVCTGFGDKK